MRSITSGTGTAYLSGASKFIPQFLVEFVSLDHIAEFQIETSSNDQDMQYLRPLNGFGLWCAPKKDRNQWIMVQFLVEFVSLDL
jgi:hypothetical protein